MHLPKHMVVAHTMDPPTSVMATSSTFHHPHIVETSKSLDHFAFRDDHSASCKAEHNHTLSEALQAKNKSFHNLVEAVQYESRTNRESQFDKTSPPKNKTRLLKRRGFESKKLYYPRNFMLTSNSLTCCRKFDSFWMTTLAASTWLMRLRWSFKMSQTCDSMSMNAPYRATSIRHNTGTILSIPNNL